MAQVQRATVIVAYLTVAVAVVVLAGLSVSRLRRAVRAAGPVVAVVAAALMFLLVRAAARVPLD